jgi:hypothetical protein
MHDRTVTLGDLVLRVTSTSDVGVEALHRMIGALATTADVPRCSIRVGPGSPDLPDRAPDATFSERRVWNDGDVVWIQDASGVVARAGPGEAWLGFDGLGRENAVVGIRQTFLPAVGHVLAFEDRFLVHAGAVCPRDRTILVLGASGAGKSTLGLAALQSGWPIVSDDLVVLRRTGDGTVEVAGVPRPPMVPTDLGADLGPDVDDMPGDPRRRAELSAGILLTGFHHVDAVVVCAHATGPGTDVEVVAGGDVIYQLIGSFPAAAHPEHVKRAHPLFTAIARLPKMRIAHGSDPSERLRGAAEALDSISLGLARR